MIDGHGRTPAAPQPAYQQVLKGLPAVSYGADELIYLPRNKRPGRIYGCSPVEQTMMTVNIALRRQLAQLHYYTEGNVPEALIGVPEGWSPEQIRQFQAYWDALLEGNSGARRHAKFVPGAIAKGYVSTREPMLKDEYDEWLARVVCFAFSIAPAALTRQMNRATAATVQEAALAEGLAPLLRWVKQLIDRVIAEEFGWLDLEFAWRDAPALSPLEQARVHDIQLRAGIKTVDEVRAELGLDPLGARAAARLDDEAADRDARETDHARETDAAAKRALAIAARPLNKAGFNPAQSRVPAGNPAGGQWSGEGGGTPGSLVRPLNWKQRILDLIPRPRKPPHAPQPTPPQHTPHAPPRPRALQPGKPVEGQTEADVKRAQGEIDRIIGGATRRPDKGSPIFDRPGGPAQAEADFQSLPSVGSVRDVRSGYGPAQTKMLPDGRTAIIRGSREGPRTLEIQPAGEGRIVKIRYPKD